MGSDHLYSVPPDLPRPEDDGACAHLPGTELPALALPATTGPPVRLDRLATPWTVIYAYPKTGLPDQAPPADWAAIPGARGCTPQNCAFRDRADALRALGASIYGLSTQTTEYQREMATRLQLPYPVLSDADLQLTYVLRLPTFQYDGSTLLRRFCLIVRGSRIAHVIYPVFPSNADAPAALQWLEAQAGT